MWFLPGPMGEEPDYLAPVPRAQVAETSVINDWLAAQASDVFAAVLRGGVTGLRKSRLLISAGWSATELVWIALPCGCLYACQAQTMTWLHSRALVGPSVASRAGRDRRIVLVRFLTVVTLKT